MGQYYSQSVIEGLNPLYPSGMNDQERHASLINQCGTGKQLIGVYDRIIFKNVVNLTRLSEFIEFEKQYKQGVILRNGFYAVPDERLILER